MKLSRLLAFASIVAICPTAYAQNTSEVTIVPGPVTPSDALSMSSRELNLTPVADGLDGPWGFSWLPNGNILVTEQFGTLRTIRDGALLPKPIAGVPEVFSSGQGGLLDVSVHPEFLENQYVYLSYSHGTEEANRLRVARGRLIDDELQDVEVVFEVAQTKDGPQHFGSRLLWLPDGTLLISVGDGGNPPREYGGRLIREQAQSLDSHLGKVIRINADGSIPIDNPFSDRPDVRAEVWSYGHRNVQGLAFDSATGRIYATEHGSQGGDELNILEAGGNFGWPLATYAVEYGAERRPITSNQGLPGMQDPIAVWSPTVAPSDMVIYSGQRYAGWTGDLFFGGMRVGGRPSPGSPPNPGALFRVDLDSNGDIASQERLLAGNVRVRDVDQGPDGYLYILTTDTTQFRREGSFTGALLRVEPFE